MKGIQNQAYEQRADTCAVSAYVGQKSSVFSLKLQEKNENKILKINSKTEMHKQQELRKCRDKRLG